MLKTLKTKARYALKVAIAFAPWVISMYILYWLEYADIWTTQTAHRGKTAVAILAAGMGLSFLVQSYFAKREQK
jgi:hypothetical protein